MKGNNCVWKVSEESRMTSCTKMRERKNTEQSRNGKQSCRFVKKKLCVGGGGGIKLIKAGLDLLKFSKNEF